MMKTVAWNNVREARFSAQCRGLDHMTGKYFSSGIMTLSSNLKANAMKM